MTCMFGFALMAWARCSITRANRSGERGQPCLVLLEILSCYDWVPFTKIVAVGLE